MSILIKGMEMPQEGCQDCSLLQRGSVFDICTIIKRAVNYEVEHGGRQNDCPLVELPPHGRLIDADALVTELERLYHGSDREILAINTVLDAPTIIEAEVKE